MPIFGLILWFTLPIPAMFPPYLVTALLALVYGVVWNCRRGAPKLVMAEAKAELPKAEISKPEVLKPAVSKPEAAKPEIPKVEVSKSEVSKPEAPKP